MVPEPTEAELLEEHAPTSHVSNTDSSAPPLATAKLTQKDLRTDSNENASNLASDGDVSKSNKTDDQKGFQNDADEKPMELDDPEVFGPFTTSQLTPRIQTDTDQGHFDAFSDNMAMLKTAIGKLIKKLFIYF